MTVFVETAFDYSQFPPQIIAFGLATQEAGARVFSAYRIGSGDTLYDIEERLDILRDALLSGILISVNDLKSHITALDIDTPVSLPNVLCRGTSLEGVEHSWDPEMYILPSLDAAMSEGPAIWESLLARAHCAYAFMERTGVSDGVRVHHPVYGTRSFTGRSSTGGYNLQGWSEKDGVPPRPVDSRHQFLLHFDWTSADARAASILSGDKQMQDAFLESDPYEVAVRDRRKYGLIQTRDEVKKSWLASLYSLNIDEPILAHFKTFHSWLMDTVDRLRRDGCLESILGRRFCVGKDIKGQERGEGSVLNAIFQGSVAHAMHHTIARIAEAGNADNLFAEIHDGLVISCSEHEVEGLIREVGRIMVRPFEGVLVDNPTFPLVVRVGRAWKQWDRIVKEVRS